MAQLLSKYVCLVQGMFTLVVAPVDLGQNALQGQSVVDKSGWGTSNPPIILAFPFAVAFTFTFTVTFTFIDTVTPNRVVLPGSNVTTQEPA
jgi:hypothetical protein